MRFLLSACLLLVVAACSQGPGYQVQTLPSGKPIKVLGVTKMHFSGGDPALILRYETDLPIDNIQALTQEAEEIWPSFRADVERAGLSGAALTATSPAKGLIVKRSKAYTFVYTKGADGQWARTAK